MGRAAASPACTPNRAAPLARRRIGGSDFAPPSVACARGAAPYDVVGENLLVVLLAVFNLCGDAAMSILIKRKLNNTMCSSAWA